MTDPVPPPFADPSAAILLDTPRDPPHLTDRQLLAARIDALPFGHARAALCDEYKARFGGGSPFDDPPVRMPAAGVVYVIRDAATVASDARKARELHEEAVILNSPHPRY